MNRLIYLVAVHAIVFISCSGKRQSSSLAYKEEKKQIKINDQDTTSISGTLKTQISSKVIKIDSNSLIKVISMTKVENKAHNDDEMSVKCKDWNLSDHQISKIIKDGHSINMHDFSYLYYVLPCEIDGEISIDGAIYRYKLNAGSFFTISNSDTTYYFGCDDKKSKGLFLMTGGDPGRDLE
jgi:hypothetical protein